MAFFFASHSATVCWILVNFSTGNLASILHDSKIMPRNDNVMLGPSTISSTRGTDITYFVYCIHVFLAYIGIRWSNCQEIIYVNSEVEGPLPVALESKLKKQQEY